MRKILILSILFLFYLTTNGFALYVNVETDYTDATPTQYTFDTVGHTVWAGAFDLEYKDDKDSSVINSISAGFCIDLEKDAGSEYADFVSITTDNTFQQITWVLNDYWRSDNGFTKNAGIQLAIWEILYGERFSTLSKIVEDDQYDWYETIIAAIPGDVSAIDTSIYRIIDFKNDKQDMITTNPVPEPATMALFGIGLLGISLVGRKRD